VDRATPGLADLLRRMEPALQEGTFVFSVLPPGRGPEGLSAVATIREPEGLTVIVPEAVALREGLPCLFRAGWLTLRVHSDLQAVGLTAAVATVLAGGGIACNVVAGAFHDHLFVPIEAARSALAVLRAAQEGALAESPRSPSGGPHDADA
jgi:hypothetical protein